MSFIKEISDKLRILVENQEDFVKAAVDENSEVLSEINRTQLSQGRKSDGSFLPDYSPTSVSVFGKRPGPMTLFDKGDVYEEIGVDLLNNAFDLFSGDRKADKLSDRYDDSQGEIFGIIPENLDLFARNEFAETLIKLNEEFLNI